MLETKEFRLGNYVRLNGKPDFLRIAEIKDDDLLAINAKGEPEGFYSVFFNGIELTEQVLLDCGFDIGKHIEGRSTIVATNKKVVLLLSNGVWFLDIYLTEIKYLHQLQNLFYALKGTELEYKPSES